VTGRRWLGLLAAVLLASNVNFLEVRGLRIKRRARGGVAACRAFTPCGVSRRERPATAGAALAGLALGLAYLTRYTALCWCL
jgi:hypothetical protein